MPTFTLQLPLPKPSTGIDTYEREKELAFVHEPQGHESYNRYQVRAQTGRFQCRERPMSGGLSSDPPFSRSGDILDRTRQANFIRSPS